MPTVHIPKVGQVNFPDSMNKDEIQHHAGRMHRIAEISDRTGSVKVTRSAQFARKALEKGDSSPSLRHFVAEARQLPDGEDHISFATARHALKATPPGDGQHFERSEFRRLLEADLKDASERAGTRADWLDVDKPERDTGIKVSEKFRNTTMGQAFMKTMQERTNP